MKRFDRTSNAQKLYEEIEAIQSGVVITFTRDYIEYDETPFSIEIQNTIDAAIVAHNESDLTSEQQEKITDSNSFDDLLATAQAGIDQIVNDKITVNNAAIPADIKIVLNNLLNRQTKEIKALAGIIRKLS